MTRMVTTMALALVVLGLTFSLAGTAVAQNQKPQAVNITNGPNVEGVGDTWAVIAWTTNTGGSSIVRYGTDPKHLDQMAESPYSGTRQSATQAQNHRVRVTNLKPDTTYYFIVDSGQGMGTGTEAKSNVAQFKTK